MGTRAWSISEDTGADAQPDIAIANIAINRERILAFMSEGLENHDHAQRGWTDCDNEE